MKKGSKEAKAWGRKMKRLRKKKSPTRKKKSSKIKQKYKRRKSTMVRRKKVKRRSKRSMNILGINTAKALSAAIYGGFRGRTSARIAPLTAKLPLGNVADEAGMLILTTLGKKYLFKKAGTIRDALTAGQTIELARLGEAVMSGGLGINFGGMGGSQVATGHVFN